MPLGTVDPGRIFFPLRRSQLHLSVVPLILLCVEHALHVERKAAKRGVFLLYDTWLLAVHAKARAPIGAQKGLRWQPWDLGRAQLEVTFVSGALQSHTARTTVLLLETGLGRFVGARGGQESCVRPPLARPCRPIQ